MSLARHTPLRVLFDTGYISRRSYNALARHGYTTLDRILSAHAGGMRFASLAGLGRKSEAEIHALAAEARVCGIVAGGALSLADDECGGTLGSVIRQVMKTLPAGWRDILEAEPGGCPALESILADGVDAIMAVPPAMPRIRVVARRRALLALARRVAPLVASTPVMAGTAIAGVLSRVAAAGIDPARFDTVQEWAHFFSPKRRRILMRRYELLKDALSVRAANLVESAGITPERLMRLFGSDEQEYHALCPGRIMTKTIGEIYAMNARFAEIFREVSHNDERQAMMWATQFFFPFLFGPSRRFVVDYYTMYGHVPLFHLICAYMRWSTHRSDCIYREAHGIIDNTSRPYKAVAARYGISCERVRQIVDAGPAMLGTEWYSSYRPLDLYPGIFGPAYLSTAPGSPLEAVRAIESPEASLRGMLHLCSLTVKATMYDYGDFAIALRGDLAVKTGGKVLFDRLGAIVQQRRNSPERRRVADMVAECGFADADADVVDVARHMAVHCFGCADGGDGSVELPRTWVDVAAECADILRRAGKPLHIDEIFRRFKRRCPEHKFTEPEQLRRLMWTDGRTRAVGKRSTYGLAEWSHIYFGTMRDLLHECLESHDEPVTLDDLVEYVRGHYPDVTASSIYASLVGDHLGRFVQYEGGFGLSSKDYPGHTPRR